MRLRRHRTAQHRHVRKLNTRKRHTTRSKTSGGHKPLAGSSTPNHSQASRTSSAHSRTLHVYTYGYCINEGKRGSRASYGVHVRGHEPITDTKGNLSKLTLLQVKQSREVASLLAVEKAIEAMCLVTPPRLALQRTLRDAYRATGTSVVLHVDLDSTMSACTTGGEQLERKGFPDRTNIGYIKRVFLAIRPLLDSKRLTICKANPTSSAHDREGAGCARQLAKDAVYKAVHDTEKASFVVNSGCTFDDSTRVQLHVPPSEYSYARSKGAWWDMEHQTFFLHREGDEPAKTDVGGYYDMRATDYTNLSRMFGGRKREA